MSKRPSTYFGEPLSPESKRLIGQVRLKINQDIHPRFDTDFNVYRFILGTERLYKKEKDVIEVSAKALNNHLRVRKSLHLDSQSDVPFESNPIFRDRLMPCGQVQSHTDKHNRLLWYLDYASINVESIAHTIQSSQSLYCQFLQFEHMLRRVNQQEEETGRLSGIRHIIDLTDYEINPFTMIFVTNGNLSYYSQLLHFENYPDLVTPMEMVNIPKWLHVPYKIARTMMPAGFNDRFRLHDDNFLCTLNKDIHIEHIPHSLGGHNQEISTIPADKLTSDRFWSPSNHEVISDLETLHISPRKSRQFHIDVTESGKRLSWYFVTDGEIYFGVFFQPFEEAIQSNVITKSQQKEVDVDGLEMVYPWLKLAARIVHETGEVECSRPGRYWFIVCNKQSWLQRRTVSITIHLNDDQNASIIKRCHTDGTFTNATTPFQVSLL